MSPSRPAVVGVPLEAEVVARALSTHSDYRVLRRMTPMVRSQSRGVREDVLSGIAVDVETTGLGPDAAIIELAVQSFCVDAHGRIVSVGPARTWLEDPGFPIGDDIARLTGLSDADLAGRSIIEPEAASMIASSGFVVAHNAGFDRGHVERRLPDAKGRPWVCSLNDLDWRAQGFEGRTLSHLLMQAGWFYSAHRASTDVTAAPRPSPVLLPPPAARGATRTKPRGRPRTPASTRTSRSSASSAVSSSARRSG